MAVLADVLDNTMRDPEHDPARPEDGGAGLAAGGEALAGPADAYGIQRTNGTELAISKRDDQASAFEEAVRTLRDSILLSDLARRPRTLLMTSPLPREGKTTAAVHLAVAHSLQKRKTLLIDADLRRPEHSRTPGHRERARPVDGHQGRGGVA